MAYVLRMRTASWTEATKNCTNGMPLLYIHCSKEVDVKVVGERSQHRHNNDDTVFAHYYLSGLCSQVPVRFTCDSPLHEPCHVFRLICLTGLLSEYGNSGCLFVAHPFWNRIAFQGQTTQCSVFNFFFFLRINKKFPKYLQNK